MELNNEIKERQFKRLSDHKEIEIVSYLKEKLKETPDAEIYIGCDSQVHGRKITYATVVVLHYRGKGGHVMYNREILVSKRDAVANLYERLWHEVELSLEVAKYLLANGVKKAKYIDIDVNPDRKWRSNIVLAAAMGMVAYEGFAGRTKPEAVAASRVADKLCK
jgi:predicted RNase H-related nuclease YkuK (DUF458 family)